MCIQEWIFLLDDALDMIARDVLLTLRHHYCDCVCCVTDGEVFPLLVDVQTVSSILSHFRCLENSINTKTLFIISSVPFAFFVYSPPLQLLQCISDYFISYRSIAQVVVLCPILQVCKELYWSI